MARLLAVALCAAAGAGLVAPAQAQAPDCSVTVRFGSYCCGVDRETARRIESYLAAEPRIAGRTRRDWGREGEFDLCLTVRPPQAAHEVFQRIGALIPPVTRAGPTSVSLPTGERVQSRDPK